MQTKFCSPWDSLQLIKNQLRDTESNTNDLLLSLCGDYDNSTAYSCTAVGAEGNIYTFNHLADSNDVSITVKEYISATNTYASEVSSTLNINSLLDDDNGYVGNFPCTSMLSDLRDGMYSNQLFADLCNIFQSSQTLGISDVYSVINSSMASEADKSKILNYIKSCASGGKISSYGFLSILQQIFSTGYDATSNDTIIMDTSSPFAIQSIVSTILSVVSTVLSTIAFAVNAAFGAVMMALGMLAQAILQLVNRVADDKVQVDLNSNTYYVQGPVKYCYDYCQTYYPDEYKKGIRLLHYGPYDIYSWFDTSTNRWINVNAFLSVGFDVLGTIEMLQNNNNTLDGVKTIYSNLLHVNEYYRSVIRFNTTNDVGYKNQDLINLKALIYNHAPRLNQQECLELLMDPDKLTQYLALCIAFDACLSVTCSASNHAWDSGHGSVYTDFDSLASIASYSLQVWDTENHTKNDIGKLWARLFSLPKYDSTYKVTYSTLGTASTCLSYIQSWYRKVVTPNADKPVHPDIDTGYVIEMNRIFNITSDTLYGEIVTTTDYVYYNDVMSGYYIYGLYDRENKSIYNLWCESIPTDRSIKVPDINVDKLLAVLAIVTTSIAAIAVGTSITGKILAKRALAKKMTATTQLNTLRDQYLADPSNSVKYKTYYKAIRRYNLKARIFGWKTYDPINNWYDEASTVNTASAVAGSSILSDTLNQASLTKGTTDNISTGVSDINTAMGAVETNTDKISSNVIPGINSIVTLIRGEI